MSSKKTVEELCDDTFDDDNPSSFKRERNHQSKREKRKFRIDKKVFIDEINKHSK